MDKNTKNLIVGGLAVLGAYQLLKNSGVLPGMNGVREAFIVEDELNGFRTTPARSTSQGYIVEDELNGFRTTPSRTRTSNFIVEDELNGFLVPQNLPTYSRIGRGMRRKRVMILEPDSIGRRSVHAQV